MTLPESGGTMPIQRVLIIACGALAHDLVRVRQINQWEHLDIECLPAEWHNTPHLIPQGVSDKIRASREHYQRIFVAYSDCGTGGLLDKVLQEEGVERLPGAHCYEMFAGGKEFAALHEEEPGTFYLTDFLARNFDRLIIEGLGIDRFPQLKQEYFRNYKKMVFLAQRDDAKLDATAEHAAAYLGLKYQRIFTGDASLQSALVPLSSIA